MSFNLVDIVKNQIGGEITQHLGGLLGNESSKIDSGIASVIPGLINGLTQRASLPGGADSLLSAVNSQDDGLLDNLGSMLGAGKGNDLAGMGTKALSGLLGSSGLGALGGIISSVSGLSRNGTGSLLGIIAPIVLGHLKKKVMGDGLDAGGLMSLLNSQKQNVQSAMPSGMLDQFQNNNFLSDFAGDAKAVTGNVANTVSNAGSAASDTGGSWIKKLLPVGAIAVLGVLAFNFFGGSDTDDAEQAVAEVSESANFDVNALGDDLNGMFDSAKGTLEGITDAGSASAALPQLTELSEQVGGLSDMVGNVPEAARGPLSGIVSSGLEALTPIIEKVSTIPGVGDVINPVIEPIIETLQGFAG